MGNVLEILKFIVCKIYKLKFLILQTTKIADGVFG